MRTFFVTVAANQPRGSGYYKVYAEDAQAARAAVNRALGNKWSMLYERFDEVHELDRKCHGTIS